jgi:2-oxo-4-hydroxy-4-carboxy-5-ureidoimidazoline decarboxylase
MTIAEFDHLPQEKKREMLTQCCGSSAWVNRMLTVFPVEDLVEFLDAVEQKWNECTQQEQMEAFEHHPKIGDINSLKERFADTAGWAEVEQSGVITSNEKTLHELAKSNDEYEDKFGFIFIVCATGRSAEEMLSDLKSRINNSKEQEVEIASTEQLKITKLRIERLFEINESSETYEL